MRAAIILALSFGIAAPAAANWIEPAAPIAPGWTCWIEHKDGLPDEKICRAPAIINFLNWQTTRACERDRRNCIEPE